MIAEIGLGLSVVAAGLWSGLLLTVTTILHPLYASRDAGGFTADMRRFLPIARRSPTNYVLVIALLVAPVLALVGLWLERGTGVVIALTAAGLAATVAGPLLISDRLAEPNYAVILGWDPDHPPPDWRIARARWMRLNWARGALTWTAFALFLAAAYAHLQ
ncbi:hypothetical protein [Pseudonocardia humida]|uniref:DUF1772 domain-containing protein n=1 Tax=Pseudonocardia humida TaxID=2800819 RepID=A0ABT1AAL5_9PSEU|nr:hypothetical protein [Pseudonocardia humida]MCO1659849.1 hypothetical protein [Pseudonocardia humida]